MTVTRFEIISSRTLMYIFAALSFVLAWFSWVKLDSAKLEVIQAIRVETDALVTTHLTMATILADLQKTVEERGKWIEVADTELTRQAAEQVYRIDFDSWREEAQKQNPELIIPELPAPGESVKAKGQQ